MHFLIHISQKELITLWWLSDLIWSATNFFQHHIFNLIFYLLYVLSEHMEVIYLLIITLTSFNRLNRPYQRNHLPLLTLHLLHHINNNSHHHNLHHHLPWTALYNNNLQVLFKPLSFTNTILKNQARYIYF